MTNYYRTPNRTKTLKKQGGTPEDVLEFMHMTVLENYNSPFVQAVIDDLRLQPDGQSVKTLFRYVFDVATFQPDENNRQTIRSPERLFKDRVANCVDYTVFISSFLTALGIPHALRMVSFKGQKDFSHVFVVIPNNYILDAVYGQDQSGNEWKKSNREPSLNTTEPYNYHLDKTII